MAFNGESVYQVARPPKIETLAQQLEELKLARMKLLHAEPESTPGKKEKIDDSLDISSVQSTPKVRLPEESSFPDAVDDWHKISHRKPAYVAQDVPPLASKRAGLCSTPFYNVRPRSIYSWTWDQSRKPLPTIRTSGICLISPCEAVHNQKILSEDSAPSFKISAPRSFDGNTYISSPSSIHQTKPVIKINNISPGFETPAINNFTPPSTGRNSNIFLSHVPGFSPTSFISPTSPTTVLNSMYTLVEEEDLSPEPQICSCHRAPHLILCKSCGNTLTGRIRKKCQVHPKQVFLMDLLCCIECESHNLKEISLQSPGEVTKQN